MKARGGRGDRGDRGGPRRAAEGVGKAGPEVARGPREFSSARSVGARGGKPGPRQCEAEKKAEGGRGGGGTRLRRGPKAGTPDPGRRPRGARGTRENRRERPDKAQEAAAQPRSRSLIQATFPFPLRQPHAVLAPSRRGSSAHPPPRISAPQA